MFDLISASYHHKNVKQYANPMF